MAEREREGGRERGGKRERDREREKERESVWERVCERERGVIKDADEEDITLLNIVMQYFGPPCVVCDASMINSNCMLISYWTQQREMTQDTHTSLSSSTNYITQMNEGKMSRSYFHRQASTNNITTSNLFYRMMNIYNGCVCISNLSSWHNIMADS